ncbi:TPA: hypothetical protein ACH3X1_011589 [Trebouxia sp. C0004]
MQALVFVLPKPYPLSPLTIPLTSPPGQPHPPTSLGDSHLNRNHDSTQSTLSDVETTKRVLQQTCALPDAPLPHPSCPPSPSIYKLTFQHMPCLLCFCLYTSVVCCSLMTVDAMLEQGSDGWGGSLAPLSGDQVCQMLSDLAPTITHYGAQGIDLHFLNHQNAQQGLQPAQEAHAIFSGSDPGGILPWVCGSTQFLMDTCPSCAMSVI